MTREEKEHRDNKATPRGKWIKNLNSLSEVPSETKQDDGRDLRRRIAEDWINGGQI